MRPPLTFFVAGLPVAQPRARAARRGRFITIYDPDSADDWKMIVRNEAKNAWTDYPNQWLGPLCVNLTFFFPRPKGHFNSKGALKPNAPLWHTSKPDRDNSDKAILDALTNLGLWGDDKQVCDGRIKKLYAPADGRCGCQVEIREANVEASAPPTCGVASTECATGGSLR